jgi:hypothetical protein
VLRVLLPLLSTVAALAIGEVSLRLLDIPGVDFNNTKYDDIVGATYYPGSTITYRNDRGAHIHRRVNSWGYPDAEHSLRKDGRAYRIGFFGDSYTESIQVPLEETYFRLVDARLRERGIECLAFGHTGFGTLHAYLESRRWEPACDIDMAVYVFCENDPADNIREISRNVYFPSAVRLGSGFWIDNSFRERYRYKQHAGFRAYDYLTAHSLLFATLASRLKMLLRYGIKPTVTEEDRMMTTGEESGGDGRAVPDETDLPSTWPAYWREYATHVAEAIVLKWKAEIESKGKEFAILYVPRPGEMDREAAEQDSWKLWLTTLCRKNDIPLIDPTPELLAARDAGGEVFYDHYTEEGHRAVARSFLGWFDAVQRGGGR